MDYVLSAFDDLLHIGVQQVSLHLCEHYCGCYHRYADFYECQDFEVFATPDATMGRLAQEYRREYDHAAVDHVGEENDKHTGHCNIVVFSFLSPIVYFYLHFQLLHRM